MKVIIIFLLIQINVVYAQSPKNDKNRQLSWMDSFDYFDDSIWLKVHDYSHGDEPKLYLKDNVGTESGVLKIRIKSDSISCQNQQTANICWLCRNIGYRY